MTMLRGIMGRRLFGALLLMLGAAFVSAAQGQSGVPEYQLGAGDSIRITVFQNPDLTLETRVSGEGTITYPLIGSVKLGGMTIARAEQTIAAALRNGRFIKEPQVSILVTQIRSHQVSVLGEVAKPGSFPLETFDARVTTLIAMAGGILPAGADTVIVTGERDGKRFRKEIDFSALLLDKDSKDDIVVSGGDVIYVPRAPVFYIYGEVQRPGAYRVDRGMTLRQALAQGGGLTARGSQRDLRVYRRGADGKMLVYTLHLDDPVQPQDVLRVGESLF
jgi:polysaccharide export outer membrane protein